MLGRAGGTGPSSAKKKRREEERTEQLFMFHVELPSAGDLWTTPPGEAVWPVDAHTVQCSQLLLELCMIFYGICPSTGLWPAASSRSTSTAYRTCLVCLFLMLSRAEALAGIVFSHSAMFISAQTQEVLFFRQSDRELLGARWCSYFL